MIAGSCGARTPPERSGLLASNNSIAREVLTLAPDGDSVRRNGKQGGERDEGSKALHIRRFVLAEGPKRYEGQHSPHPITSYTSPSSAILRMHTRTATRQNDVTRLPEHKKLLAHAPNAISPHPRGQNGANAAARKRGARRGPFIAEDAGDLPLASAEDHKVCLLSCSFLPFHDESSTQIASRKSRKRYSKYRQILAVAA